MSPKRAPRPPNLTRRSVATLLVGLTLLVTLVTVASGANTDYVFGPPAPPTEQPSDITTVTTAVARPQTTQPIRLESLCFPEGHCRLSTPDEAPIYVCPKFCGDIHEAFPAFDWITANPDDPTLQEDVRVAQGVRRTSSRTNEIEVIDASAPTPPDYISVRYVEDELVITDVGDPGMFIARRVARPDAVSTATGQAPSDDTSLGIVAAVLWFLAGTVVLVGVFGVISALQSIIDGPGKGRSDNDEDDEDELDEEDDDVTAPIELAEPLTFERATERAAVVRDLLDAVRGIEDPRASIQRGYATLETGFGKPHLARLRNETSSRYLRRVLGSSEEVREPMVKITELFERARFSDLDVDDAMRAEMISALEDVQQLWERRALKLMDDLAPPVPNAVHDEPIGGQIS